MPDTPPEIAARFTAPDEVWDAVRADYLAGRSGPDCCRRHGVGIAALRARAARDGWRRIDQLWKPPSRSDPAVDPWDDGVALEAEVGGNLDQIEYPQLIFIVDRRATRCALRGDAGGYLRWRKVREALHDDWADTERFIEQENAAELHRRDAAGD